MENEIPNLLGPSCGYTDLLDYAITEKLKEEQEKICSHIAAPLVNNNEGYSLPAGWQEKG